MKYKIVSALTAALITAATLSMTALAYGGYYDVYDPEYNDVITINIYDYPGETIESFCEKHGFQLVGTNETQDQEAIDEFIAQHNATYAGQPVNGKSSKKAAASKKTTTQTQTNTAAADTLAAQKVQQLYSQLLAKGLSSDKAMAQVNAQLPTLIAQAQKEAAAASKSTAKTAAEAVSELYAQLIAQGMTSDKAMAQVNAQLPTILAKYSK